MKIKERKEQDITFIEIRNDANMNIILVTLGASIYQIETLDCYNHLEPILLTPSNFNDFYLSDAYFGKTVGRYAGRIKNGEALIDNKIYNLSKNENNTTYLHGGNNSLSFQNFDYKILEHNDNIEVIFNYFEIEKDLPGDVNYQITYQIAKKKSEFTIFYQANSNKNTIINLTNHSYFNLSGNFKRTILDEKLKLYTNKVTTIDNNLIPISLDKVTKITNFQRSHKIGKYINDESLINHKANGYDHCFYKKNLNNPKIALLKDNKSKRKLLIETSYPAIVVYTYNYTKDIPFMNLNKAIKHQAIALECQFVPNDLQSCYLNKDNNFSQYIKYKFFN